MSNIGSTMKNVFLYCDTVMYNALTSCKKTKKNQTNKRSKRQLKTDSHINKIRLQPFTPYNIIRVKTRSKNTLSSKNVSVHPMIFE